MKRSPRQRAFVLIAVLMVVLLTSMVAISLMFRLRAEELSAAAGSGADRAWAAAMSGVTVAMEVAAHSAPGSLSWQDNPEKLAHRLVWDDGTERWYFTVFSAATEDPAQPLRYGLADEAAKLNLLQANEEMLQKLPRLSAPLAQALADYIDADQFAHPEGAEQEYYDRLPHPYPVRNGPLASLDQLLQVRGFSPALLYGEDANLSFRLDANEDDGNDQFPPDNNDGQLDRGLRAYVTISSYEPNVDGHGLPRRNLNDPKETFFDVALPASVVQYVDALRRNMIWINHPADLLAAKGKFKDKKGAEVEMESGVGEKELPTVLDQLTSSTKARLPGLVNVLTAPPVVLQTLPGIDLTLAEAIVAGRRQLNAEQRRTIAWLYQEKIVDAEVFKRIAPRLTTSSAQFHFQVIGYSLPSGRYRVLEAEMDLGTGRPVITYLRDLTALGLPFSLLTEDSPPHG